MRKKKSMYDMMGEPLDRNYPTTLPANQVQSIVAKLRAAIDELGKNFANAKSLILELAKLLDEIKQCEQSQICKKIKELLKDKITEKWIEECLPREYKRKYVKSELTSLSQDEDGTKEKILVDISGRSSTAKALSSSDTSGSSVNNNVITEDNDPKFKASKVNQNILVGSDNQETPSSVVPADKLQNENKKYLIPKEKYDLLMAAMKNSEQYCIVIFDRNGRFIDTEPDISGEINTQ